MLIVAIPAICISTYHLIITSSTSYLYYGTIIGKIAMISYTTLFKPNALGDILIFIVWGPSMTGYGINTMSYGIIRIE